VKDESGAKLDASTNGDIEYSIDRFNIKSSTARLIVSGPTNSGSII
jgi:hypothetical protein